jgi:hypothetical protein
MTQLKCYAGHLNRRYQSQFPSEVGIRPHINRS